jgi:hypothetical protein
MTVKFARQFGSMLALVLLLAAGTADAQFNASLSGTVLDSTQAAIPGAKVTLTNTGTQATQVVTSGSAGSFAFNALPPGSYTLQVEANGFQGNTINNVSVTAETPRNLNVTLQAGKESQTVTVDADTLPVLQTDDANVSRTLTNDEIERLPLFGADPYELLRTAPGITGDGARSGTGGAVFLPNNVGVGGSNSGIYQTENQPQISADGQPEVDNNFMIDGVSVNSLVHGGAAVVSPNQESVASINVISSSYDAEDGRNSGAQIKVTTKSGTNQIHGSLNFVYDEPGLNSFNGYAGPVAGSVPMRVQIKQRTYAASLGGPILKNKLFLFASYQGYGQGNNTLSAPLYVDTASYRASVIAARPGGLSAATLANPLVTPSIKAVLASNCALYANNPTTFFPNKVNGTGSVVTQTATNGPYCQVESGGVDIGSVTPGGASQLGVYLPVFDTGTATAPGPALGVGGAYIGGGLDTVADLTQAQLNVPSHSRGNQFNGRVDYQVTKKDLVAGSVYFTKLDNLTNSDIISRPLGNIPFKPLNSAGTLIYLHTFSASWLNELRSNITRFHDNGPADFGNINLGIPYTYVQQGNVFNEVDYGVQGGPTQPAIEAQNTIEVRDQVTHTFGSHVLKMGGGFRWEQDNDNLNGGYRPDFDFAGFWNLANDASFFESQYVNPANGGPPLTNAHYRSQTFYAYLQHDWRVTPTLTFNAGFRYEVQTPWHRKAGAASYEPVFGSGVGNELIGLSLQPVKNLYNTDYGHYEPKLSFAYNPAFFANKVVIRGGGAIAYNHLDLSLFENIVQNGPGVFQFGVCCGESTLDGGTPRDGGLIDYVHGTSTSLDSYPVNPAFATGNNAAGFPIQIGGGQCSECVGLYGVGSKIRNPVTYFYSLTTETLLTKTLTLTVEYTGSLGRHLPRLVNQNFLYPVTNSTGATPPDNSDFQAQTDSSLSYNALNVRVVQRVRGGLQFDGTYTWSKNLDNITNGDQSDGSANQTDPLNNALEWGRSDNDVRNRFTGTVLYTSPTLLKQHKLLSAIVSGYQANTIVTLHSGFSWTPVVSNSFTTIPNSSVVSPIRPIAFATGAGIIGNSCSNSAFETGSNFPNRGAGGTGGGTLYYSTAQPSATVPYIPVVGRNSLTGPCYRDVDFSLAKQVHLEALGHTATLRFQANLFNAFNILQLQPIVNEGFGTNITSSNFGQSQGADAGRVIEFLARLQF